MRIVRLMAVLTIVLALSAPVFADALDDLIAGVQAKYGKAKDLTVQFEQVVQMKQMGGREQKAKGVIYFARPNKMRWVYESAPRKEIITDGTSLVLYYVDEKKAHLTTNRGAFNLAEPMALLAGDIDIKTTYAAELLPAEGPRARIKLTPKKPMGVAYLIIYVDEKAHLVARVDSLDAYGNLTRLDLNDQRFNTGVPESRFTFTPQEGVEITDAPLMEF